MSDLLNYSVAYKPFLFPKALDIAKLHEKVHWIEDEVSLKDDVEDWKRNKLTAEEKEFVTQILKLFTQSDVAVGHYYYDIFIPLFKNNEVRNMLGSFAAREAIHQRAYALLNETLGLPDKDFVAFKQYKEMKDKAEFIDSMANGTPEDLGVAIAKAVFTEGISLFASFAMLLSFQRFGFMKGMGKVVEWSIRDESIHVEGLTYVFKEYCKEHREIVTDSFKRSIYTAAREVVALEDAFIASAFKLGQPRGLQEEEVKQYIRYITDRRLLQLGLKPEFKVKNNPLEWLEHILNGTDHTNFFENRVTQYSTGGLLNDWDYERLTVQ